MDVKIYECMHCETPLSLQDRPVMTIRKKQPMYTCQNCWETKERKQSSGAMGSPKLSRAGEPATASTITPQATSVPLAATKAPPPIAPKPAPKASTPQAPAQKGPAAKTEQVSGTAELPELPAGSKAALKTLNAKDAQLADETDKKLQIESEFQYKMKQKEVEKTAKCFVCHEGLTGTYYTCGDLQYHEKCITCVSCGKKDRDSWDECVIFPTEDGKGVKFYCPECSLASAPVCYQCSKPITDGALTVGAGSESEKNYHADCLNCGHCGKNMAKGEDLIYLNGVLSCASCRKERGLTCKRCKESISGAYNTVPGNDGGKFNYHAKCFLCTFCQSDLNERELGGQTKDDDKEVYCKDCYLDKFCEKCSRCPKPLIGAFFRISGDKICKDCCRCGSCGGEIAGQFKMKPDGTFQCVSAECPGNREAN